ncbi:putative protease YrrO [Paenibacillus baekrokdamisoli]|uniref:Putative protease YrrO n=2 Tax=Paenibacillus baekrokdamisoli TaxID=1712516 RepID=A0A3G9J6C8_9BACL|nr:putative protease [Paenibacillus baekrokdamisoli]BBH19318.1 putative protease YrrO [Paenibacillus baekrokdamisoli]
MMRTETSPRYSGKRHRLAKPELLAPAGNLEKLKFAVHYGADAVYIGGQKYGLRSNADNFSFEEMKEGVEFASRYGAKVFVATNIYAHNEDIAGLEDYLRSLQDAGIAAIIAADPVIIETAQRVAPKLEVHLSTQQSTLNWQAVQFWKEEQIPRVVLAREVSLEEIAEIKAHVDIEIEAFIHGAMCSSFSGRCVLSNHFTDRDSNRGGCSQSCRWKYDIFEEDMPMFKPEEDKFTMGSKDLCMLENIPDLIEVGVDSFKIEGRMKSLHYVATVVNAYRQAIDSYMADPEHYELKQVWLDDIQKAANRPLNTGFFYDTPGSEDHIYEPEEKLAPYDFAGVVLSYDPQTELAVVQQRNHFKPGQEVEFFGPQGTFFKQTVGDLTDTQGNALDAARHPLQSIVIKTDFPVKPMDMMRKRVRLEKK